METFEYPARSEADTERLATALAASLPAGSVVALQGTLGAGKTRLVQAFGKALGIAEGTIVSPTFVLMQQYAGRVPIYHYDAYRIADDDEFLELGPEETYQAGGYVFLEWADRVARCLPQQYLRIELEVPSRTERLFRLTAVGESFVDTVERIARQLRSEGDDHGGGSIPGTQER